MSISSLGIGSGLDLGALVDRLLAAEREPREQRLDRRETNLQAQISAFGTLRGSLAQMESALGRLARIEDGRAATTSNDSAVRVTASPAADPGRFTVEVEQLATAESRATLAFDDADASLGTGTLSLQVGSESAVEIQINSGNDSLRGVRDAINASKAGVQASIVNDSSGARLVLTSDKTGAENTIALEVNPNSPGGGSNTLAQLAMGNHIDPGNPPVIEARDAELRINGLQITSASNELKDVIDGLTLELRGTTDAGSPATINITQDRGAIRDAVRGFIEAYNSVVDQTNQLTRFNPETREAALLVGDGTVRSIRTQLNTALNQTGGPAGAVRSSLVTLGVRTDETGKLSLDEGALNRAMDDDFGAAVSVLNDVAGGMRDTVRGFTEKGGLLETRTDGLRTQVREIGDQRERLDLRMEQMEARLVRQFGNLDALVGQLQTTSNFLDQQLAPLADMARSSFRRR